MNKLCSQVCPENKQFYIIYSQFNFRRSRKNEPQMNTDERRFIALGLHRARRGLAADGAAPVEARGREGAQDFSMRNTVKNANVSKINEFVL